MSSKVWLPNRLQALYRGQGQRLLYDVDFDELPQPHMIEVQKAQEKYGALTINQEDPLASHSSTFRPTVAEPNDCLVPSTATLSPLEKFYYKYIACLDQRENPTPSRRGICGKKNICRKSSADNTISSLLDSLTCDDSHKLKEASCQAQASVVEMPLVIQDTSERELDTEAKCLLGKDWEGSEMTGRSETVYSYARQEDVNSQQMDLTLTSEPVVTDHRNPAAESCNKKKKCNACVMDEEPTSSKHCKQPTILKESHIKVHINPEFIRISDKKEQTRVSGKSSQIIIFVPNKNHGVSDSNAGPSTAAAAPQSISLAAELTRTPMHITGENVYINIGGENTQIKSYKDYGTVKIIKKHPKKLAEASEKIAKTKSTVKTSVDARRNVAQQERAATDTNEMDVTNVDAGDEKEAADTSTQGLDSNVTKEGTNNSIQEHCDMGAIYTDGMNTELNEDGCSLNNNLVVDKGKLLNDQGCYIFNLDPAGSLPLKDAKDMPLSSPDQEQKASKDFPCKKVEKKDFGLLEVDVNAKESFDGHRRISGQLIIDLQGAENNQNEVAPASSAVDSKLPKEVTEKPGADNLKIPEEATDELGLVDVYSLRREVVSSNRQLRKTITKFRDRTEKVIRLQNYIDQLKKETVEMKRLLAGVDRQMEALRTEASEMRCTVTAICDLSGMETEARRLEPACYRRYMNIHSATDATSALTAVRKRIKALSDLEVLIYRKQLALHHVLPTLTQEKIHPTKQRAIRPGHKASKCRKTKDTFSTQQNIGGHVIIEVVSPVVETTTLSISDEVSHTESPLTISVPLSGSNDGKASTQILPDTEMT